MLMFLPALCVLFFIFLISFLTQRKLNCDSYGSEYDDLKFHLKQIGVTNPEDVLFQQRDNWKKNWENRKLSNEEKALFLYLEKQAGIRK